MPFVALVTAYAEVQKGGREGERERERERERDLRKLFYVDASELCQSMKILSKGCADNVSELFFLGKTFFAHHP